MKVSESMQRITYGLMGDKRYQYFDSLVENSKFSRKEMETYQGDLIAKLVSHAYSETAYYKNLLDENGIDPDKIIDRDSLKKIPVLTKHGLRENFQKLQTSDGFGRTLFEVTSGGSTGNLAVLMKSSFFEEMSRAAMLRHNLLVGWKPSDKSVWIWGAPYEHQKIEKSIVSRLGLILNRRLLFNAYKYTVEDFPSWVIRINSFRPKVLYGYASIILEFSKYLIANNIQLDTIKIVVSTTEKLLGRATIKKAFRCKVVDQYGCREIPAIGIEVQEDRMLIADDLVVLNVDAENNILLTALHSYGFPLINYKVGDVGELSKLVANETSSMYPFTLMRLIIGRETDNFISSNGARVSSSAMSVYISTLKIPIDSYQIVQLSYTGFNVNYVSENLMSETDELRLSAILHEYFGEHLDISYAKCPQIPTEISGKKLLFKRMF